MGKKRRRNNDGDEEAQNLVVPSSSTESHENDTVVQVEKEHVSDSDEEEDLGQVQSSKIYRRRKGNSIDTEECLKTFIRTSKKIKHIGESTMSNGHSNKKKKKREVEGEGKVEKRAKSNGDEKKIKEDKKVLGNNNGDSDKKKKAKSNGDEKKKIKREEKNANNNGKVENKARRNGDALGKRKKSEGDDKEQGDEKSESVLYQFPHNRIHRIIKTDNADCRMSQEAIFLVNKATEKFLEVFCREAYACAFLDRNSYVGYDHLSSVVSKRHRFDFLSDFVPQKVRAEDALAEISEAKET